jgi:hypothetical protein
MRLAHAPTNIGDRIVCRNASRAGASRKRVGVTDGMAPTLFYRWKDKAEKGERSSPLALQLSANGFNESVDPKGLQEDITQAVSEFDESIRIDPGFVDAKVGAISCLSNPLFLNQKNPARVQELVAQAVPLRKEAEAAAPENPRLLWVLGPICWYAPPERGCSQDKAMEMDKKGLEAARKQNGVTSDPLEPSWGEAELLAALAWANLHRTAPDLDATEQYAHSALILVPYWHYVRDILMPQIQEAKKKAALSVSGIEIK